MSLTNLAVLEKASLFAKSKNLEGKVYDYMIAASADRVARYADMSGVVLEVRTQLSTIATAAGVSNARILISAADGTVLVDTNGSKNTHANVVAKDVSENHNSRIAIISAALSSSGVATEKKYSSSTGRNEEYLAVRVGSSAQDAIAVIRYSVA